MILSVLSVLSVPRLEKDWKTLDYESQDLKIVTDIEILWNLCSVKNSFSYVKYNRKCLIIKIIFTTHTVVAVCDKIIFHKYYRNGRCIAFY